MILREVGACDGGGLFVDLGVQALELALDAQERARGRQLGQRTCAARRAV